MLGAVLSMCTRQYCVPHFDSAVLWIFSVAHVSVQLCAVSDSDT